MDTSLGCILIVLSIFVWPGWLFMIFWSVYLFGKCVFEWSFDKNNAIIWSIVDYYVLPSPPSSGEKVMINHPNHRKSHEESSESSWCSILRCIRVDWWVLYRRFLKFVGYRPDILQNLQKILAFCSQLFVFTPATIRPVLIESSSDSEGLCYRR